MSHTSESYIRVIHQSHTDESYFRVILMSHTSESYIRVKLVSYTSESYFRVIFQSHTDESYMRVILMSHTSATQTKSKCSVGVLSAKSSRDSSSKCVGLTRIVHTHRMLGTFLPTTMHIHQLYMVLANPTNVLPVITAL
jgi:hypothetical protein